jgi:hypothetical protein
MAARNAPARHARHEGQRPQMVLAWRRRARGHEWPESSTRTRRGSPAARRPATRQGDTTAHPNAVGAKQSRGQGGRKGIRWLRWCSRWGDGVVVAGLSVAWRRCSGRWRRAQRCRCPRWCRCSRRRTYSAAPVRAPAPGSRPLLLPVRRATRRDPPLARRRRAGVAASSLGPAQLRRLLLLLLTALSQMGWKWKTPMGLVAVDNCRSASSLAFEPQRRKGRAKSLRCPGLDRPGTRGGAASSQCTGEVTWARRGGKRGFSPPGPGTIRARARPVPRRAGRLAGAAIPSRAPCAVWPG